MTLSDKTRWIHAIATDDKLDIKLLEKKSIMLKNFMFVDRLIKITAKTSVYRCVCKYPQTYRFNMNRPCPLLVGIWESPGLL